jgi:chitodextrinase
VTGYRVSRNGEVLTTTGATSFVDDGVPAGVELNYQVAAVDAAGNFGKAAKASARDTTAPTWNGALSLVIGEGGVIEVSWPAAVDNAGVVAYEVSRDDVPIATLTTTTYDDASVEQMHSYSYGVIASDAAGNKSVELPGSITVPDLDPPGAVGNLVATQSGPRQVDVSWTAAADTVGVDHYVVTLDGLTSYTTSATSLAGVAASDGETHSFSVAAVDAAGNLGAETSTALTLPDATAPGAPGSLVATALSATSVGLTWTAATDNVAVSGYVVRRDGAPVATLGPVTSFTDSGVPSDHTYTYSVAALDAAGNEGSPVSATVTLVSVDTVAPSVPTGLNASAIGGRRVSLTWLASTDNRPGTIKYKIFRGTRKIATVTSLSYVDRPASVGWYRYRIRAVDAAGNRSAFTAYVRVYAKRS